MFKTQRYQVVEIPIPNNSTLTKFNFPDLPQLTGRNGYPVKIDSIVFYSNSILELSPLSGSSVIDFTDLKQSYLTLYQGDLQTIYNIPCIQLSMLSNNSSLTIYQFQQPLFNNLINVSWTKSYISLANQANYTNVVYCIGIHYSVEY